MKHVPMHGPRGPLFLLLLAALHGGNACAADSGAAPPAVEVAAAAAPVARTTVEGPDLASLKRDYLACEHEAAQRALGFGRAARCSQIYEALLREGFGGRFEELHAWWRGQMTMP